MAQETISIGGLVLRFLQTKEGTGGSLDAFEMTVQPNARMPIAHYHDSWDETVVGLMGVSTWRVGGQDISLEPGQSIFIKRGIVHAFRNDSEGAASCLCILTPGVLGPGYFSRGRGARGRRRARSGENERDHAALRASPGAGVTTSSPTNRIS